MSHGLVHCSCRDCFEVAVCGAALDAAHRPEDHLCGDCADHGCDGTGESPCRYDAVLDAAAEAAVARPRPPSDR